MAWVVLFVAGLFEVGWAVAFKYTEGFTRLWPTVAAGAALVVSMALLGIALKTLPLGTAYAVWTGIGAIGTVVLGIVLFGESASALRLACVGLILAGIVGLKLVPDRPRGSVEEDVVAEETVEAEAES
jgi:quaternary ammonium compound-resistance protein SugE